MFIHLLCQDGTYTHMYCCSYIVQMRQKGQSYKDSLLEKGKSYIEPLQLKLQPLRKNLSHYEKKLRATYDNAQRAVATHVETFKGKAGTLIKQAKNDPEQFWGDTKEAVGKYATAAGNRAGEVGKDSVKKLEEVGQKSVDKINTLGKEAKDLVNDVRKDPEKYKEEAIKKYQEAGEAAEELGEKALRKADAIRRKIENKMRHLGKDTRDVMRDVRENPETYGLRSRTRVRGKEAGVGDSVEGLGHHVGSLPQANERAAGATNGAARNLWPIRPGANKRRRTMKNKVAPLVVAQPRDFV